MARVRMVTRTIEVVELEVMCLDTSTAQVTVETFEVTGKQEKAVLDVAKKMFETDTKKLVALQAETRREVLYGMSEVEFLKYAQVLPPRTVSADEE